MVRLTCFLAIHKLAKRLSLRQQVTATAVIYLRRFYLKNSYCGMHQCLEILHLLLRCWRRDGHTFGCRSLRLCGSQG